jgi:hypothetical protein
LVPLIIRAKQAAQLASGGGGRMLRGIDWDNRFTIRGLIKVLLVCVKFIRANAPNKINVSSLINSVCWRSNYFMVFVFIHGEVHVLRHTEETCDQDDSSSASYRLCLL